MQNQESDVKLEVQQKSTLSGVARIWCRGPEQLASVRPRSFSVGGPSAWNSLPPEIKMASL